MHKLTIELAQQLSDILQTGSSAPNQRVTIYRADGKGSYEHIPFVLQDVIQISLDRRWNMSADELEVEVSNINGYYSPEYSNNKVFDGVKDLPLSGWKGVIKAFNKVTLELGYGDELVTMFTGQISNVDNSDSSVSIKFNALNNYRKYLKPIDPIKTKTLVYENTKAFDIILDLTIRAGIKTEEITYESDTIDEKDFEIEELKFNLGTNYSDAIKQILETMSHRIYCDRYGVIQVKKINYYTQQDFHNHEFNDYINLTDSVYKVDPSILRNRVIITGSDKWQAFEDKFLIDYLNNEIVSSGIQAKWAETEEQKWAIADSYFMSMRRKLRRISVAVIGNPTMDVGDLVRMKTLISTANDKYMIIGIQSSFSSSGYIDQVDLEYIGAVSDHICDKAEGEYEDPIVELPEIPAPPEIVEDKPKPVVMDIRDRIVDTAKKYLNIWYQWGGNYPETKGHYGLDCSHLTYRALKEHGIMKNYMIARDQYKWCTSIQKKDLKPGDLVFYIWPKGTVIQHVVMYIGNNQTIGSNGGDSTTTNTDRAKQQKAFVKIQSLDSMGPPTFYGRPKGLV